MRKLRATKHSIPMTRAAGFGPLPKLLSRAAGTRALRRVFDHAGVPMPVIDYPKMQLPVAAMLKLFEQASHELDDRCFGLRVGEEMLPETFGDWLVYCNEAPTLGEAIARCRRTIWLQQPHARIALERDGPIATWRYYRPADNRIGIQHADHVLPPMIRLIRIFLGNNWLPGRIEVPYPRDHGAQQLEDRIGAEVHFNCKAIGIRLHGRDLSRHRLKPVPLQSLKTYGDIACGAAADQSQDDIEAIRNIVRLRLLDGKTDIDGVARLAGFGPRTLQRRLARKNLSYRQLLDDTRVNRALGLIAETRLPLSEIARLVGYDYQGNLTRAVRRSTGQPPSALRKRTTPASNRF